jgi:GT2 family glycosyltransferase
MDLEAGPHGCDGGGGRALTSDVVDVVIVAFGAAELLEQCLSRLGGTLPVVIVDNSSDAEVRAVADLHGAQYVDPGRNLGFGAGVNVGVAHLHHPVADVLLLNPDAQITSAGVDRLRHCLHAVPDLGCVAPAQVDQSGRAARVGWPFPTPWGAWVEAVGLGGLRRRQAFMIGSVLLVRSTALTEVGPFDERFFLYAEETDWQRRAHDLGWGAALCPEVTALHVGAGTGGDESERDVHFHASQERYIRKHHATTGWLVYRTAVMTGALVRSLVLPGLRRDRAAARFRLYRRGPCRVESEL